MNINYCIKNTEFRKEFWHESADYKPWFDEAEQMFTGIFEGVEVEANYDKPQTFENFEFYIRGVGPVSERDSQGRFWLYKKDIDTRHFEKHLKARLI